MNGGEELDSKNIDDHFEEQKNRVGARKENRLERRIVLFFQCAVFQYLCVLMRPNQ